MTSGTRTILRRERRHIQADSECEAHWTVRQPPLKYWKLSKGETGWRRTKAGWSGDASETSQQNCPVGGWPGWSGGQKRGLDWEETRILGLRFILSEKILTCFAPLGE